MYRLGSLSVIVLVGAVLVGDILFTLRMASDILGWSAH